MRALLVLALFATLLAIGSPAGATQPGDLPSETTIWHSYRGEEERDLQKAVSDMSSEMERITLLAVPFDAYLAKLSAAIPSGNGPDIFIDAHERLGLYVRERLVVPIDEAIDTFDPSAPPELEQATQVDGIRYGVPLAAKALALYTNPALLPNPPGSLEELAEARLPAGVYPLAYEAENVYFHAAFLHGFGGRMLDEAGTRYAFSSPEGIRSVDFVRGLLEGHKIPAEPSGALVQSLFVEGRAAAVIAGPSLALEIGATRYRVSPLPRAKRDSPGPLRSYVTIESVMITPTAPRWATRLARNLARRMQQIAATRGGENARAFRESALAGIPMSKSAAMRAVWQPTGRALKKALRGDVTAEAALQEAERRFYDALRPPPLPANKNLWLVLLGALLAGLCGWMVLRARALVAAGEAPKIKRLLPWTLPAALGVLVLVVVPLAVGAITSFYAGSRTEPYFVGTANYVDIVTARGGPLFGADSVYRTLAVTVLWTVVNLALHVGIGLVLGSLLAKQELRFRALYRILLVVPWAVPSYVTALVWKGMFHRQFGAINALLGLIGAPPVSWFSQFATAFTANVITNAWLGFPFMMVVVSGALSSMDKALLEAAEVDGATRWQRFRLVTLPLVLPSLAPALALGAVWTFNMFNVVYLVSGGEPDGATDILVSEAYRWAFTREAQVGYATAYAVLIFLMLFGFARMTRSLEVEEKR